MYIISTTKYFYKYVFFLQVKFLVKPFVMMHHILFYSIQIVVYFCWHLYTYVALMLFS